jgi:hypothetical protein
MEEVLWERPPGTAGRAVVNFFGGGVQVTSGRQPMSTILPALIHYTSLKLENSSLQCVIFRRVRCGAISMAVSHGGG